MRDGFKIIYSNGEIKFHHKMSIFTDIKPCFYTYVDILQCFHEFLTKDVTVFVIKIFKSYASKDSKLLKGKALKY